MNPPPTSVQEEDADDTDTDTISSPSSDAAVVVSLHDLLDRTSHHTLSPIKNFLYTNQKLEEHTA